MAFKRLDMLSFAGKEAPVGAGPGQVTEELVKADV
jgi:hypothetical protein